ncbi:MAG TPA: hypothetical protein VF927_06925 [Solirubrobacteraceae bacterium]
MALLVAGLGLAVLARLALGRNWNGDGTEEARILRLAEEDVFRTFRIGVTDEQLRPRLERLLQSGEAPEYEPSDP